MAAKKKAKKARKAPAKKKPIRKAAKKIVKTVKTAAKKAAKAVKKTVKATVKKAPAKKVVAKKKTPAPAPKRKAKQQIVGEGDYAATKAFDTDQAAFVKKNKARIPRLGKDAEAALEGPEGAELQEAEATAAARSRDTFEP